MKPTSEQLRDFFKSEVFQADLQSDDNCELAIQEFYNRFYSNASIVEPIPNPRKWQTTHVRKYAVKSFLRTKDGAIHQVIFKQGLEANQITNFDGSAWEGDHNLLDVWQEYYESDHNFELNK